MTLEEAEAKSAALTLILDGLAPNELYQVLLGAGVYAPAVSSTAYVIRILEETGVDALEIDAALHIVSRSTISHVADILRDSGELAKLLRALTYAGYDGAVQGEGE